MHASISKHARILKLFKEKRRLTQRDLSRISLRYGAYISDLRAEGHEIVTIPMDYTTGRYEYQYKRGPARKKELKATMGNVTKDYKMEFEKSGFTLRRMLHL